MQFLKSVRVHSTDLIAILFVIGYFICKIYRIDTAIDAAVAMIIAFYFGSKHMNNAAAKGD